MYNEQKYQSMNYMLDVDQLVFQFPPKESKAKEVFSEELPRLL